MVFPKALIFDMDGLMLNSEVIFQQAWQTAMTDLGYAPLDQATYLQMVGCSNDSAETMLLQHLGSNFPVADFRTRWMAHWETLAGQGIPLQPGLEALLDWLEAIAMPKAVGTSSGDHEAHISLKSTGLWPRFDAIITVDKAGGLGKPAPNIFLMAAQALKTPAMDCLVLEDSNAGVEAAVAAGMPVIMVPDLQTPTPYAQHHALRIAPSLHGVLQELQQMHGG